MGEPDYQGFCEHVEEWNKLSIPYGISDLIRLAERYGTPIPKEILEKRPIRLNFSRRSKG